MTRRIRVCKCQVKYYVFFKFIAYIVVNGWLGCSLLAMAQVVLFSFSKGGQLLSSSLLFGISIKGCANIIKWLNSLLFIGWHSFHIFSSTSFRFFCTFSSYLLSTTIWREPSLFLLIFPFHFLAPYFLPMLSKKLILNFKYIEISRYTSLLTFIWS